MKLVQDLNFPGLAIGELVKLVELVWKVGERAFERRPSLIEVFFHKSSLKFSITTVSPSSSLTKVLSH